MYLTRHLTAPGPRWALDGQFLPIGLTLDILLMLPQETMINFLQNCTKSENAKGSLLPPVEPHQEVWGSGVTYLRSRDARKVESDMGDVYEKVYEAERPEIFFKAIGWRAMGHQQVVRIRKDSQWDVPEPELTLVMNSHGDIVGYAVGNDMSSRSIEGENPLYLPQAKTYNGSCAVGPGIRLIKHESLTELAIQVEIQRDGATVFQGETSTNQMKRHPNELAAYLYRELDFPHGSFLMTGTGIVPPDEFTLQVNDVVRISIEGLTLENQVKS